ncbi:hypothetical protein GCM10010433_61650 [Streptomyces pulveraceus]
MPDGTSPGGEPPCRRAQARLAAVDAALERIRTRTRIRTRAAETGEPLLDRMDSAALRTLRALAAEDQESFDAALADLLTRYAGLHGPSAPSTLLPRSCPSPSPRSPTAPWAGFRPSPPTTCRTR